MAIIFRKSVKVAPGVRVNLSKRGASVSVGTKGARVSISKRGMTKTVGIPGTGIYNREYQSWNSSRKAEKRAIREARSNAEKEAFSRNPITMMLSVIFIVFSGFAIALPGIPFWLFFPSAILGIALYVMGMQKH